MQCNCFYMYHGTSHLSRHYITHDRVSHTHQWRPKPLLVHTIHVIEYSITVFVIKKVHVIVNCVGIGSCSCINISCATHVSSFAHHELCPLRDKFGHPFHIISELFEVGRHIVKSVMLVCNVCLVL